MFIVSLCFASSTSTYIYQCMYMYTYMYIHVLMACIMVRTDYIRSERVNKETLLGRKLISIQNCKLVHQLLHCMYVCINYCRIRTERVNEEIIPPREKAYFRAKLQVKYIFTSPTSSCIVIYVCIGMACIINVLPKI